MTFGEILNKLELAMSEDYSNTLDLKMVVYDILKVLAEKEEEYVKFKHIPTPRGSKTK